MIQGVGSRVPGGDNFCHPFEAIRALSSSGHPRVRNGTQDARAANCFLPFGPGEPCANISFICRHRAWSISVEVDVGRRLLRHTPRTRCAWSDIPFPPGLEHSDGRGRSAAILVRSSVGRTFSFASRRSTQAILYARKMLCRMASSRRSRSGEVLPSRPSWGQGWSSLEAAAVKR